MDWLLVAAHWLGGAVCDQLPTHSYYFDGVVLPLCARCTGLYLGAVMTLGFLNWRHPRAAGLPRPWIMIAMVLFFFAWAGDGVNSLFSVIPIAPHLYTPENILRLITGTLMGVTIGSVGYVMFNGMVWSAPGTDPILTTREFVGLLGLGALLVVTVQSEWAPLLYPLNVAMLIAVPLLHVVLITAFVASVWRRASTWRQLRPSLAVGTVIVLGYLNLFAGMHAVLLGSILP
ncbi:MAG: DUF2085 domain-containing protein [Chloroflexi bacterium]|nr:DUF2085 domain-containing protein [Chloroflexota bacterium]